MSRNHGKTGVLSALLTITVLLSGAAAQEKEAEKKQANPTGTWKWERKFQDQTRVSYLRIKRDGKKITGTYKGSRIEQKIEEPKLEKDKLTFTITFERDGQKTPISFEGTIKGDALDGKVKIDINGEAREFDWKAARTVEREDVVGKWEFTIPRDEGEDIKFPIEFKIEGEKLTGTVVGRDGNVAALEEVTIKGTTLTFQVTRTRDGQEFTTKIECKPRGDQLTGKVEGERNGEAFTINLTAKRLAPEKKEAKKAEENDKK